MEKSLVIDLGFHKIYYVKFNNIRFYINIPKTVMNTNITLELKSKMGNFDIEHNDRNEVLDNLRNTYNYIDCYNITLVLPILDKSLVDTLEKINKNNFDLVDTTLGAIINSAYKCLIDEGKRISNQIVVINNERYKSFITWFTTRYHGRVTSKNLLELIQIYNVNATSYMKMETPVMNFVVGSYNNEIDAPKIEIETPKEEIQEPKMELVKPKQFQPAAGFGTYLTFILIAVGVILIVVILTYVI